MATREQIHAFIGGSGSCPHCGSTIAKVGDFIAGDESDLLVGMYCAQERGGCGAAASYTQGFTAPKATSDRPTAGHFDASQYKCQCGSDYAADACPANTPHCG